MLGRLTCDSSCRRLGDAEASITLRPRSMFKAGRSRGSGGRGPFVGRGGAAVLLRSGACSTADSYAGGSSSGILTSDIFVVFNVAKFGGSRAVDESDFCFDNYASSVLSGLDPDAYDAVAPR